MSEIINVGKNYKYLLNSKAKIDIIWGGRGSGKSHDICDYFIYFLLTKKNENAVIFRNFASDSLNTYRYFSQTLSRYPQFFRDKIKLTVYPKVVTYIPNKVNIFFFGLDNPENTIKSLPKDTYLSWFEEADQGNEDAFFTYFNTLRGEKIPKHILSFNPVSSFNWTKKLFFDNREFVRLNNVRDFHTTVENNNFISDDYKQQLRNLKYTNPDRYEIDYLGNWGTNTELTYFKNVEQGFERPDLKYLINFGLDFGYNDPTVFCATYIFNDYLYVEIIFNKTNLSVTSPVSENILDEINKGLLNVLGNFKDKVNYIIFGDTSDLLAISTLQNNGIKIVGTEKGAGSILAGIKILNSFRGIRIIGNDKNTYEDFKNYSRDKKNSTILETPAKNQNDHTIDAVRYSLSNIRFIN